MALLTFIVGLALLRARVREMRRKRLDPQSIATSSALAARLEDIQPADNFRNLFEVPVLFYALVAIALALDHVPTWLIACAWLFVALRALHSLIHCTYNAVLHRLLAFLLGFGLLIGTWIAFFVSLAAGFAG